MSDTFSDRELAHNVDELQSTLVQAQQLLVDAKMSDEDKMALATYLNQASGLAAQIHARVDAQDGDK